ncbi:MAG: MBL fold metallo-hydrolase [Desulfosudaceae bacterium]
MKIKQFRYGSDNLAYLVYGQKKALAVDPGAVSAIIDFLGDNDLVLQTIVNTHTHPDHTSGNKELLRRTGADYIDMPTLFKNPRLDLEGERIDIYHTPGHTMDSAVFHCGRELITGDTLFNGKAGRCFTGDLARFLESIKTILTFPEDTVIYGGHDYVLEYLETAREIEPDNPAIDDFLKAYNPELVRSTLAGEKAVNPTLRFNTDSLIEIMKNRGLPVATEYERWCSIMSLV